MIVYLGIILWLICVNVKYGKRSLASSGKVPILTRSSVPVSQVLWTMGVLVFFIGLRSAGADTHAYIQAFKKMPSGMGVLLSPLTYVGETEWLFYALGVLCKTICGSYHLYLFVIAAISGCLTAFALRRESAYYPVSILLFMLMSDYGWMINGIRQFLAASILFYASKHIAAKSFLKFLPYALLAMFIHNSSVLMFPVFFVVQGEAWNKRTLLFLLAGILSVVFIGQFLSIVDTVTMGTVYDGYMEKFQEYGGGSNIFRTLIFSVPPVLAFLKREEIKKIASPFINVAINMSICCAVVSLVANFTSGILVGRLPIYFSLYNLVLLPWLLYGTSYNRTKELPIVMYVCYFIVMFVEGIGFYYSDILFGGTIIPGFSL